MNNKSPQALEFSFLKPFPLIVNVVPVCVPAEIVNFSVSPVTVGILSSAPSVAWVIVIGIVQTTL